MAVTMRIAVLQDVPPCGMAERYHHLWAPCCFHSYKIAKTVQFLILKTLFKIQK